MKRRSTIITAALVVGLVLGSALFAPVTAVAEGSAKVDAALKQVKKEIQTQI